MKFWQYLLSVKLSLIVFGGIIINNNSVLHFIQNLINQTSRLEIIIVLILTLISIYVIMLWGIKWVYITFSKLNKWWESTFSELETLMIIGGIVVGIFLIAIKSNDYIEIIPIIALYLLFIFAFKIVPYFGKNASKIFARKINLFFLYLTVIFLLNLLVIPKYIDMYFISDEILYILMVSFLEIAIFPILYFKLLPTMINKDEHKFFAILILSFMSSIMFHGNERISIILASFIFLALIMLQKTLLKNSN
jgi:hypothetical protein